MEVATTRRLLSPNGEMTTSVKCHRNLCNSFKKFQELMIHKKIKRNFKKEKKLLIVHPLKIVRTRVLDGAVAEKVCCLERVVLVS